MNLTFRTGRIGFKLVDVSTDSSDVSRRLSDLRRAQPADSTMQNLLVLLSAKLELCARLPVYEYEAGSEGHPACAETFHNLADVERESFNQLIGCLSRHLSEMVPAQPRAGAA